ncbi:hypothetical protein DM794_06105 [Paenarthrobacter ureafaciens]|uniref:hypothetical protein n=1 Tax=Paenarthrobacter ureafaciens TaxID=37931 RepID=UPI0015BA42FE|nr:hypothetical protein [Paenarthrobacter ureafaciens]NWL26636.1 hypothetical protein [Paenarthrobacter ureafaciens]
MATQNTASAVVLLEVLAKIVEKSPATYSADASAELAANIRSMAEEVTKDANVDPDLLNRTRDYGALDWHNEIACTLINKEHRAQVH